jgi:hypothetical protein
LILRIDGTIDTEVVRVEVDAAHSAKRAAGA